MNIEKRFFCIQKRLILNSEYPTFCFNGWIIRRDKDIFGITLPIFISIHSGSSFHLDRPRLEIRVDQQLFFSYL